MALEGIEGIRLTDIYGYNKSDYDNYVNNNIKAINTQVGLLKGIMTEDEIKQKMYLDNLLKNKLGNSYEEKTSGLDFDQRLDLYNGLLKNDEEFRQPIDTLLDERTAQAESTGFNSQALNLAKTQLEGETEQDNYFNGNIPLYSESVPEGLPSTMNDYFKMMAGNKERVDIDDIDELIDIKLGDKRFSRVSDDKQDSQQTKIDVDKYSQIIREKLDADPQFTYEFFKQFDRGMRQNSIYYNNRHDTWALPINPNEMKDIMAKYYAINVIQGEDKANEFGAMTFQNIAADTQTTEEKLRGAIKQGGANFAGSAISFLGIVGNLPTAFMYSLQKNKEYDDLSWFNEFLMYAADNPLTRYGNDIIETGVWDRSLIDQYKEYQYNPNTPVRRYGEETELINENTAYDLISQIPFTLAGMGEGAIVGAGLKATVGAAANAATRKLLLNAGEQVPKWIPKFVDMLGNEIVVSGASFLPAASEASFDALRVYDTTRKDYNQDIDRAVEVEVEDDLKNGKFQEFYDDRMAQIMAINPQILSDESNIDNIENQILNEYISIKKEEIYNNPKIKEAAEKAAFRAAARTMGQETAFITFGDSFFTNVMGGAAKNAKKALQRAVNSDYSNFKLLKSDGRWKAEMKDPWRYYAKGTARGLVEAGEEGVEEGFQNVDSQMNEDLAHDYIYQYVLARHDPEALKILSDSAIKNWDVASKSLKQNLFSPETIQSFWIGAISAGLGTPTPISGARQNIANRLNGIKNSSLKDFIKNEISPYWRSPIAESVREAKEQIALDREEIAQINRWLQEHPELDMMQDENAISSWLMRKTDNEAVDNEVLYRDSLMGYKVSTLTMMDRLRGSGFEKVFSSKLNALANLKYDGSNATESVINQAAAIQGKDNLTEEERREIFDDVVSKAKDAVNLQKDIRSIRSIMESNFGNILSKEAIDAWTFATLSKKDAVKRIKDISKSVVDAYNGSTMNDKTASESTSLTEDFKARYISVKNAEKKRDELQSKIKQLKKNSKNLVKKYGLIQYENTLNSLKRQLQDSRDAINFLKENDNDNLVITEDIIAGLKAKALWSIINPINRNLYSKEQQEEITKFLSKDGITKDIIKEIQDASELQESYEKFDEDFRLLQKDSRRAVFYDREIKSQIAKRYAQFGLKDAIEADTYEKFKEEYEKFLDDPNLAFSRNFASEILEGNEFFKRYTKEQKSRESLLTGLLGINAFKNLSEKEQRIILQLYNKALRKKDSPELADLYDELTTDFLKRLDIDMSEDELIKFNSTLRDVFDKFKKYQDRVNRVNDVRKTMTGSSSSSKSGGKIITNGKKDTILNNETYTSNKQLYIDLFDSMREFLTKKTNSIKLYKDSLVQFMRLFVDSNFGDVFVSDIDPTELTVSALNKLTNKLQDTIDSVLQSEDSEDRSLEIANTQGLINAINSCIAIFNISKQADKKLSFRDYLKDLIIDLDPLYEEKYQKGKRVGPKSIGYFGVKPLNKLTTESEKKFYQDNNILENLRTLYNLWANEKKNGEVKYVFIKDSNLIDTMKAELGIDSFDSDNLPLVAAAIVPVGTEGSINVDGQNIIKVGVITQSRKNPDTDVSNSLNALRELALEKESDGIIHNDDGSIYVNRGFKMSNINRKTGEEIEKKQLKDVLKEKYGDNIDAIVSDVIQHTVMANVVYDKDKGVAVAIYNWNGKSIQVPYETQWLSDKTSTQYPVYIDESNPKKPIRLLTNSFSEIEFPNGRSLFDILSNDNICDGLHHVRQDSSSDAVEYGIDNLIAFVSRSTAELVKPKLFSQFGVNRDAKNKSINNIANDYVNFGKRKQAASPYSLQLNYTGNTLSLILVGLDGKEVKKLSEVNISDNFSKGEKVFRLNKFFQEGIKNLIFDEDGNYSINQDGFELVKPQVTYDDFVARRDKDGNVLPDSMNRITNYVKAIINRNSLSWIPINPIDGVSEETTLEINETSQKKSSNSAKTQADAIEAIKKDRVLSEEEEADRQFKREPGSMGVTTFISEYSEEPNIDDRIAMSLGSSIDKLVRIYFRSGGSTENILKWMNKYKVTSFVGIGGKANSQFHAMIRQIQKIDQYFKDRGEVPITEALPFTGKFKSENGKFAKLTAIPDIVTVDRDGYYHIYDMKSFRAGSPLSIFNWNGKLFDRANISKTNIKKWTDQLSLYKMMLEESGYPVKSIAVIPIALSYDVPNNVKLSSGNKYVVEKDGKIEVESNRSSSGYEPLLINSKNSLIYNDVIDLEPISDVSKIQPTKWSEEESTESDLKGKFEEIKRRQSTDKIDEKINTSEPEFLSEDASDEELLRSLGIFNEEDTSELDEILRCGK